MVEKPTSFWVFLEVFINKFVLFQMDLRNFSKKMKHNCGIFCLYSHFALDALTNI